MWKFFDWFQGNMEITRSKAFKVTRIPIESNNQILAGQDTTACIKDTWEKPDRFSEAIK